MTSKAETAAITRALLALLASVVEIDDALLELTPPQNERFLDHIKASHEARNECLEQIKALLELMEKDRE
jgi:hypothetical protein